MQTIVHNLQQEVPTILNCVEDFAQIEVKGEDVEQSRIGLSKGKWLLWIGESVFGNKVVKSEKVNEGF